MQITVAVNRYRCKAMQKCVRVMPDAFEMGAAGYSKLLRDSFGEQDLPLLRKAVASCPSRAISVQVEDEDDET
jgi:ferredoxin